LPNVSKVIIKTIKITFSSWEDWDPTYSIIIYYNILLDPTFPASCMDMPVYLAAIMDK